MYSVNASLSRIITVLSIWALCSTHGFREHGLPTPPGLDPTQACLHLTSLKVRGNALQEYSLRSG
jgi:hypothetical protein